MVLHPTVDPTLGASDHNIVLFSFIQQRHDDIGRCLSSAPSFKTIWPPHSLQNALEYLDNCNWALVFSTCSTPSQVWDDFKMVLHHCVSTYAVKVKERTKASGKLVKRGLITKTVRRLLNCKKRVWRRLCDFSKFVASYTILKKCYTAINRLIASSMRGALLTLERSLVARGDIK